MELLTIFTPTYNREKKLYDTFLSLKKQSNTNFVWLIVDDGSTDNTEKEVKKWIKNCNFSIVYKKKNNGGKHTAYNYALQFLKTKYVYLSLDSDDVIYDENTIDKIIHELESLKKKVGLITLCSNSRNGHNDFVKKYDLTKLKGKSLAYAYTHNIFHAEARMILQTDYVKQFRYPEIENERFFTEAYVYYQMNEPVKWTNIITSYSEYLEDGLTANANSLFVKNPKSWYLYNELRMRKNKSILLKLKFAVYYISFGILSNQKVLKYSMIYNMLLILLYPLGICGALYLKKKG